MLLRVQPARRPLVGSATPPGDKSISHRAALLGGLGLGTTRIRGFLTADDTLATLAAMAALGVDVARSGTDVEMHASGLRAPDGPLDLGNSGTGMRLLAGALAGHPDLSGLSITSSTTSSITSSITLVGDASLSARPMERIIEPLAVLGARIDSRDGHAPLVVRPRALHGGTIRMSVASAQVKSALVLAAIHATGRTEIVESGPTRDHTERLLPAFGVALDVTAREGDERNVVLVGPQSIRGAEVGVPGDLSAAAFIVAAALLVPGSQVRLRNVGLNPTRDGFLRVVAQMSDAACLAREDAASPPTGDEPVGDLVAQHATRLCGTTVPEAWVPLAIDEFPVLMALAAAAQGQTVISGAAELRVKESDRLAVMSAQLRRLGVAVDETPDGARITGGPVGGGRVDAMGDHRIAMSLAVLALVAAEPVLIDGAEWIATSYPGFVDDLVALGAEMEWIE